MGQQHNKVIKRRRRKAYLERIKAKVREMIAKKKSAHFFCSGAPACGNAAGFHRCGKCHTVRFWRTAFIEHPLA